MKIKLNYLELQRRAEEKGIHRLSELCCNSGVAYVTLRNGKTFDRGISIETAWLLSEYLNCTINDIVTPVWEK